MTFEELKFTGDEIFKQKIPLPIPGEMDSYDVLADILNRILKEKLERAPEVFQRNSKPYTGKEFETGVWTEHRRVSDTHKARLICIEEIK